MTPKPEYEQIIKDPYVLEFLDLPANEHFYESTLEQALIDHLQKFLLEGVSAASAYGGGIEAGTEAGGIRTAGGWIGRTENMKRAAGGTLVALLKH